MAIKTTGAKTKEVETRQERAERVSAEYRAWDADDVGGKLKFAVDNFNEHTAGRYILGLDREADEIVTFAQELEPDTRQALEEIARVAISLAAAMLHTENEETREKIAATATSVINTLWHEAQLLMKQHFFNSAFEYL